MPVNYYRAKKFKTWPIPTTLALQKDSLEKKKNSQMLYNHQHWTSISASSGKIGKIDENFLLTKIYDKYVSYVTLIRDFDRCMEILLVLGDMSLVLLYCWTLRRSLSVSTATRATGCMSVSEGSFSDALFCLGLTRGR